MNKKRFTEIMIYFGPITLVLALFVIAPLLIILFFSFLKTGDYGRITFVPTMKNYLGLIGSGYVKVFFKSLYYALQTNILCILISYPLAYYIVRYGGRWKTFLVFMIVIPSWTAYIIRRLFAISCG